MKELFNRTKEISKVDIRDKIISDVVAKATEELGEVSAECLKLRGYKPLKMSETKDEVRRRLTSELGDLFITLFDIAAVSNIEYEEIKKEIDLGLDKWSSYANK